MQALAASSSITINTRRSSHATTLIETHLIIGFITFLGIRIVTQVGSTIFNGPYAIVADLIFTAIQWIWRFVAIGCFSAIFNCGTHGVIRGITLFGHCIISQAGGTANNCEFAIIANLIFTAIGCIRNAATIRCITAACSIRAFTCRRCRINGTQRIATTGYAAFALACQSSCKEWFFATGHLRGIVTNLCLFVKVQTAGTLALKQVATRRAKHKLRAAIADSQAHAKLIAGAF